MKVVKKVNPESSHHKKKKIFYFVSKMMIAVHLMMYVTQVITLYTLSSYSALYQLYLSKTGKEKKSTIEILIK